MKKRSISSLFKEFDYPEAFLKMSSFELASLQAQVLGAPFDGYVCSALEKRAERICSYCGSRSLSEILCDLGLKVVYKDRAFPFSSFISIFSMLDIDKRKIIIYADLLQEISRDLYKFVLKLNLEVSIEDIAVWHEICHFIDCEILDKFEYSSEPYSEMTVCFFLRRHLKLNFYSWLLDISYAFYQLI